MTEGGAAVCKNRHTFDRSREGYYNLLLSGGKDHGDNALMVGARREFLSRGYYRPLADRIAALASEHTPRGGVLLDSGMGEGYYTELIAQALQRSSDAPTRVLGFDISKDACKKGAKRLAGYISGGKTVAAEIAVASSYRIPLPTASVDSAVNIFSPLAKEETARVIRHGGRFIYVIPAPEHLFELKALLYDEPYRNAPGEYKMEGFSLIGSENVRFTMTLDRGEDIKALFMMTPYAYRTGKEGRERLFALESLSVTADFEILIFERI